MQKPEWAWVAKAAWVVVCAGGTAVAHAGPEARVAGGGVAVFVPVLTASEALLGARLLAPELEQGRYARVQTRLALPAPLKGESQWQVAAHATYEVDCDSTPPAAVLAGREPAAPGLHAGLESAADSATGAQELVDARHAIHAPPEAGVAAAFACLAARPGYLPSEAAQVAQQTAGLAGLERWDCTLTQRSNGEEMQLAMSLSDDPPAVRVGEKWMSTGVITPAYVAVTDAGLDIRLMRATGALRVVSRAEMSSVALGACAPHLPKKAKKESGW